MRKRPESRAERDVAHRINYGVYQYSGSAATLLSYSFFFPFFVFGTCNFFFPIFFSHFSFLLWENYRQVQPKQGLN